MFVETQAFCFRVKFKKMEGLNVNDFVKNNEMFIHTTELKAFNKFYDRLELVHGLILKLSYFNHITSAAYRILFLLELCKVSFEVKTK